MQPYQQASRTLRKQQELPIEAVSAAAGAGLTSKVLPLLSQYLPAPIRNKALSKIDPRLASFVDQALDSGFDLQQISNFFSQKKASGANEASAEQAGGQESSGMNQAQDFETRYPQLAQGIAKYINQGQTPQAAAALIKEDRELGSIVKKFEKESGMNFVDFIIEIMGNKPKTPPPISNLFKGQVSVNEMQQPTSPTGDIAPQTGVDPKLMALLNSLQQGIKNLKGPPNG